jgi:hypothetical protein
MSARDELPATFDQPRIPQGLTCLRVRYLHDGMYLDLWGDWDEDEGFSVISVALSGQEIDIGRAFSDQVISQMGSALDREFFRMRQADRQEARADAAMWERMQV